MGRFKRYEAFARRLIKDGGAYSNKPNTIKTLDNNVRSEIC